jgi:hypothetical protein
MLEKIKLKNKSTNLTFVGRVHRTLNDYGVESLVYLYKIKDSDTHVFVGIIEEEEGAFCLYIDDNDNFISSYLQYEEDYTSLDLLIETVERCLTQVSDSGTCVGLLTNDCHSIIDHYLRIMGKPPPLTSFIAKPNPNQTQTHPCMYLGLDDYVKTKLNNNKSFSKKRKFKIFI